MEEAGCDEADLLAHLRGPGPHVRGCWAVDLLLGKSCPTTVTGCVSIPLTVREARDADPDEPARKLG